MKTLTLFLLLLCTAVVVQAQDARPEPQFMVVNQNQVAMKDFGDMMKMWFETAVPELKGKGMLKDYGLMQHAWGDEWNYNFYFVTDSHESFLEFWDAYMKGVTEKDPELAQNYLSKIKAHRDNMYTLYK